MSAIWILAVFATAGDLPHTLDELEAVRQADRARIAERIAKAQEQLTREDVEADARVRQRTEQSMARDRAALSFADQVLEKLAELKVRPETWKALVMNRRTVRDGEYLAVLHHSLGRTPVQRVLKGLSPVTVALRTKQETSAAHLEPVTQLMLERGGPFGVQSDSSNAEGRLECELRLSRHKRFDSGENAVRAGARCQLLANNGVVRHSWSAHHSSLHADGALAEAQAVDGLASAVLSGYAQLILERAAKIRDN
ncbi:MAG: hypothetical protein AAFQ82_01460 [Myxococcota bacterium]